MVLWPNCIMGKSGHILQAFRWYVGVGKNVLEKGEITKLNRQFQRINLEVYLFPRIWVSKLLFSLQTWRKSQFLPSCERSKVTLMKNSFKKLQWDELLVWHHGFNLSNILQLLIFWMQTMIHMKIKYRSKVTITLNSFNGIGIVRVTYTVEKIR